MSFLIDCLTEEEKKHVREMAKKGLGFLWLELTVKSSEDQIDKSDFSWIENIEFYEENYGPFPSLSIQKERKKEEIVVCPTANGYVQGQGEELCRIVQETQTIIVTYEEKNDIPVSVDPPRWMFPRLALDKEDTYNDQATAYSIIHTEAHKLQAQKVMSLIPEKYHIKELGAGSGIFKSIAPERVTAYDIYPASDQVQKGDMNEEILNSGKNDLIVLQYAYVFLDSRARMALKNLSYLVIDDPGMPIPLTRTSRNVWSNVIGATIPDDRSLKSSPNLPFTSNLINLKEWDFYSQNEYVQYKWSRGEDFTEGGVKIISSFRELVWLMQDEEVDEVYFAPQGRILKVRTVIVNGSTIFTQVGSISVVKGQHAIPNSFYYQGETFFIYSGPLSGKFSRVVELTPKLMRSLSLSERDGVHCVRLRDTSVLSTLDRRIVKQFLSEVAEQIKTLYDVSDVKSVHLLSYQSKREVERLRKKGLVKEGSKELTVRGQEVRDENRDLYDEGTVFEYSSLQAFSRKMEQGGESSIQKKRHDIVIIAGKVYTVNCYAQGKSKFIKFQLIEAIT